MHTTYVKNEGNKIVRLNTVILTKLKVQSINDVTLPTRAPHNLRGEKIRLYAVHVCDDTKIEILENLFFRE